MAKNRMKSRGGQANLLRERQNALVRQRTGIDLDAADGALSRRASSNETTRPTLGQTLDGAIAMANTPMPDTRPIPRRQLGETDDAFRARLDPIFANRNKIEQAIIDNPLVSDEQIVQRVRQENERRAMRGDPPMNPETRHSFIQHEFGPAPDGFDFGGLEQGIVNADILDLSQTTDGQIRTQFDELRNQAITIGQSDDYTPAEKEQAIAEISEQMHGLARQARQFRNPRQEWQHPTTGKGQGEAFELPGQGTPGTIFHYNKDRELEILQEGISMSDFATLYSTFEQEAMVAAGGESVPQEQVLAKMMGMMQAYQQFGQMMSGQQQPQQHDSNSVDMVRSRINAAFEDTPDFMRPYAKAIMDMSDEEVQAAVNQTQRAKQRDLARAAKQMPVANTAQQLSALAEQLRAGKIKRFIYIHPEHGEIELAMVNGEMQVVD